MTTSASKRNVSDTRQLPGSECKIDPNATILARPGKHLTFNLAHEVYGIEVLHVREIVAIGSFTAVPHTPKFIKGVMNLRGKIVPLVDLRLKFGMETCEYSRETCVVVVEVSGSREKILIGVIVDSVREVIDIAAAEIAEVPSFGIRVNTAFLSGLANSRAGLLILLLDIEHVLSHEEMTAVEATPEAAAELNADGPDSPADMTAAATKEPGA
jgi:purine-binding chemotaxis protein CheW